MQSHQNRLYDSFFTTLPPSLTSLNLIEFSVSVRMETITKLPKNLVRFTLSRPHQVFETHSHPFDFDHVYDEEPSKREKLWRRLELLPKLLWFTQFNYPPNFERELTKMRLDDLTEACPNVAFDGFTLGTLRPMGTKKR